MSSQSLLTRAGQAIQSGLAEVKSECIPKFGDGGIDLKSVLYSLPSYIHIPYFPAFNRPGWLKGYIVGPHNAKLLEDFTKDLWAGVIVALTLLPQGLSYGVLANLPAVNGLYCAILPSATYTFFGSAMQLGVGPVAIVSLLVGKLVTKYIPDPTKDIPGAIEVCSQAALICGIYLVILSIFKAGYLIQYISHPVMSGFTSAAAMLIGFSQVRSGFGFPSVAPQTGQKGYTYNYQTFQWYIDNWNGKDAKGVAYINPIAVKICFGIYIPLIIFWFVKEYVLLPTPERKSRIWYKVYTYISAIMPLFAIIIGAQVAKDIILNAGTDPYAKSLKVVGTITPGLNFINLPKYTRFPWNDMFADVLPLTLISFMESYSVGRKIAVIRNELHILNADQELWAIGAGNLMASISSAYCCSGSFSRSALNAASGAVTPLSKATTMSIICIALASLAKEFYYIPNPALSAIIWVALTPLISPPDLWQAWKHSKKDFLVMLITGVMTFAIDTEVGLAVGLPVSFAFLLTDFFTRKAVASAVVSHTPTDGSVCVEQFDSLAQQSNVEILRVNTDLNFVTVHAVKKYVIEEIVYKKEELTAVVLDFGDVYSIDLTALLSLKELSFYLHSRGLYFIITGATPVVQKLLDRFAAEEGLELDSNEGIANSIPRKVNVKPIPETAIENNLTVNNPTVVIPV